MANIRNAGWQNILRLIVGTVCVLVGLSRVVRSTLEAQENRQENRITSGKDSLIRAGDRVAWLGGQLWEQMQERAELNAILAIRLNGQGVSFRNVSWSGDDVTGRARGLFGNEEAGYQRRLADLKMAKPTVVFVAYGQSEALDLEFSIEKFRNGIERLIRDLTSANYRIVLLAPLTIPEGTKFPGDIKRTNARIAEFTNILVQIAQQKSLNLIDLPAIDATMSDDGLRLHAAGYAAASARWADALVGAKSIEIQIPSDIVIRTEQASIGNNDWKLSRMETPTISDRLAWEERSNAISELSLQKPAANGQVRLAQRRVQIAGMAAGKYALYIDGDKVAEGSEQDWATGKYIDGFGIDRQRIALQRTLVRSDQLFMYRYRPHNETYLLLFRKHEQGNNAAELDKFDQLTVEKDGEIQELARPKTHRWELRPIETIR